MADSDSTKAAPYPLPVPSPRSPPKYPDVFGRHRKQAELQAFNREIGFLEEELQSLDTLHPASKCCKEVHEFVGKNPDPLIPLDLKVHRSSRFWKWLCLKCACNFSWLCCCSGCSPCQRPKCNCNFLKSCPCFCPCCCCHCYYHCLEKSSFRLCCRLPRFSCTKCCSCSCDCSYLTCRKVGIFCSTCKKHFCETCCLCS